MATSGRINTGGCNSSYFYFQWQLAGQNEDGNYSVINWQVGINIGGGAWWGTNAVRIDAVTINGSGNITNGTWSGLSGNGDHHLRTGQWTIGHNGDGNKDFGAYVNGWLYSCGNYATSGAWSLPGLYQYADPTGFYVNQTTDVSMTLRVTTNRVVDNIAVSLTGGGNWYYFDGATTDRTMTIGSASNPLPSNTTYPVRISLHRQSNGYWKEAGNWNVATNSQNNFFDVGDM